MKITKLFLLFAFISISQSKTHYILFKFDVNIILETIRLPANLQNLGRSVDFYPQIQNNNNNMSIVKSGQLYQIFRFTQDVTPAMFWITFYDEALNYDPFKKNLNWDSQDFLNKNIDTNDQFLSTEYSHDNLRPISKILKRGDYIRYMTLDFNEFNGVISPNNMMNGGSYDAKFYFNFRVTKEVGYATVRMQDSPRLFKTTQQIKDRNLKFEKFKEYEIDDDVDIDTDDKVLTSKEEHSTFKRFKNMFSANKSNNNNNDKLDDLSQYQDMVQSKSNINNYLHDKEDPKFNENDQYVEPAPNDFMADFDEPKKKGVFSKLGGKLKRSNKNNDLPDKQTLDSEDEADDDDDNDSPNNNGSQGGGGGGRVRKSRILREVKQTYKHRKRVVI